MIAGPHFGDYKGGFQFGRLGYELVERRGLRRYQAKTYMAFGNFVMPWTRHVRTGRDLVRRAFDIANKAGDLTFAAYSRNNLNTNFSRREIRWLKLNVKPSKVSTLHRRRGSVSSLISLLRNSD